LTDCGPNYGKTAYLRPRDQLGFDAPALEDSTELFCRVEKLGMFLWLNRHFKKMKNEDFNFDYSYFVFIMIRELGHI
jgi:hypothetical protein